MCSVTIRTEQEEAHIHRAIAHSSSLHSLVWGQSSNDLGKLITRKCLMRRKNALHEIILLIILSIVAIMTVAGRQPDAHGGGD